MFSYKNKLDKNLKVCLDRSYYNSYRVLIKCKKFFKDIEKLPPLKGRIIRSINSISVICANLTPQAIVRLLEYPEIEYIAFDEFALLCGLSVSTANGLNISRQTDFTGNGVTIGLIDSGVYPHPDLLNPSNKVKKFVDLLNEYNFPYDDNGHGTVMAGILCGSGYSSKFVYKGIAEKSEIYCYKAFNATGKGYISDILFSLEKLVFDEDLNIRILCLPFELTSNNIFIMNCFDTLLEIAVSKNIIPIVPAGNSISGEDTIQGIALSPNCLTIGGLDTTKTLPKPYAFSPGGNKSKLKKPNLSAACMNITCLNTNTLYISEKNGVKLYPPKLENSYITFNGTSVACAYMCGICALLLEHNPNINLKDISSLIKISCFNIDEHPKSLIGEGTIDLSKFLK